MAEEKKEIEKNEDVKIIKIANALSIAIVLILSAAFVFQILMSGTAADNGVAGLIIIVTLIVLITTIKNAKHYWKLSFNIPIIIFIFYTVLMMVSKWSTSHYLYACLAICAISCIYSNFTRTTVFIITQNLIIAFLFARGTPIGGPDMPTVVLLENWLICIFASAIMLVLTRSATVVLSRAVEHQHSFRDLLSSTEIYVAMVDESNNVVYASKTLAQLGGVEDQALVQGRPLIDLFPGRTLKINAGKMLKEKEEYAEDWEFSLNGQKRFFKAAAHGLEGNVGVSLISLYDMTHLAERDEIAVMKDSMQIGLFFMDPNFIIQDHYSRYLEEMLSETDLFGKAFTDVISASVTPPELVAIKDYFGMVMERTYDQEMLDDINPLNELHYFNEKTGTKKVFQFAFATIERGHGEVFLLVTVYDITARVELQQRLAEEEARRQEEMQSVFELIQVEPGVFNDFMSDMEYEFGNIERALKDEKLTAHDALVKVYQGVHAIKSNAVILGLNVFGNKVHNLESKIKKLREMEGEVPFSEMLNLTMDIEHISQEREGFKTVIDKLQSYSRGSGGGGERQNVKVFVESLAKTTSKASEDMGKKIKFAASEVDPDAIDNGPRRVMKEVLMQLIRNSVVHGVEFPDVRKAKGKNETGIIKLSIKMSEDKKLIQVKLSDDGQGLDYRKIAEKAVSKKLIKKEDANNKDMLLKAIFLPGFSTAETEGVHAGRGIGLNLVKDRVKEVNGVIKLRSEKDKGTLFMVTVPVGKDPQPKEDS